MLRAIRNCSSWLSLFTSVCVAAQFSILAATRINPNKPNDVRNTIFVSVVVDGLLVGIGYLFFTLLRPSSENTPRKPIKERIANIFTLFVQLVLDAIAWMIFIPIAIVMSLFTYSFCSVIVYRGNKMLHDVFELWGSCAVLIMMLLSNGIIFTALHGIVWTLTRYPKRSTIPTVLKLSSFLLDVQLWLPRLFTAPPSHIEPRNIITRGVRAFETCVARPTATVCSYMFLSILCMAVFHEERAILRYVQYVLNFAPFMRYLTIAAVSLGFITNIFLVSKNNMPKTSVLFIVLCVLMDMLQDSEMPTKYKNKTDIWVDQASKMIIDFGFKTGNAKAISGGWIVITPYVTDAFNTSTPTFTDPSLLGYKQDEYEGTISHERGHIDTRVFWTMISALVFASNFHGFNIRRGYESVRTLLLYFTSITAVSWCDELIADMSAGDKVRSYVIRGWGTVGARAHPPGVLRFLAGDLSQLYCVMQYLNYLAYAACISMIVLACRKQASTCKEESIAGEDTTVCEEAG